LYRDENHLVLLDGYSGDATQLSFEVTKSDQFSWSPDGKYLLSRLHEGDDNTLTYCLNLYDVDAQKWAYPKPISCTVNEALFNADGSEIVYTTDTGTNGLLWRYTLADKKSQKLYQTTEGDNFSPMGISGVQWSPTETYLTFIHYRQILGGTLNFFVVLNIESQDTTGVIGGDGYYAYYDPIWSKDDRWFLITLQDQYVTSGTIPYTNDEGDVYLVNAETGNEYRLTYTPAVREGNIHWTDNGKISFNVTTVQVQDFTYTPQQAMHVEALPNDQIVYPDEVNPDDYYPNPLKDVTVSPDPNIGAWVSSKYPEQEGDPTTWELNIGDIVFSPSPKANFSVPVPESYQYSNVLIGWRPTDYDYGGIG
jgi:Tol biopolymer transport system component